MEPLNDSPEDRVMDAVRRLDEYEGRTEPLNDSEDDVYATLRDLVDEALSQYDRDMAVDLEDRYRELAKRWGRHE